MSQPRVRYDTVSITKDGKEYHGRRMVEGTTKLLQTVYYGDSSRYDGHPYKQHEYAIMDAIAKAFLRELVDEAGDSL